MTKPEGVSIRATVNSFRLDRDGNCKLVLDIPGTDAVMATALGLQREQVFVVEFKPDDFKSKGASL